MTTIGQMLHEARVRLPQKTSQEMLAAKLNPPVTKITISKWETGEKIPTYDRLEQLALQLVGKAALEQTLGQWMYVVAMQKAASEYPAFKEKVEPYLTKTATKTKTKGVKPDTASPAAAP